MAITGIKIPFNLFELRGQLDAGGVTSYPAAFADTDTLGIPTFGPYMVIAGLASDGKAAGQVAAEFSLDPGASYPIKAHRAALLLVDPDKNEAVYMDYLANLSTKPDTDGNLKTVTLTIPAATKLPARVQVYVMLDVFPEAQKSLDVR